MKGYPKTIQTKADIENLLAVDAYKDKALAHLQALLDERYQWNLVGKLGDDEDGNTGSGYKVAELTNLESGEVTERYQYEWGVNTFALDRMGITVAECVAWGCEDRVIAAPNA